MRRGPAAIEATGMPVRHGEAFQRVSNAERCVIAVRSVGVYATGLLLESYATKGFHNKAKSCDWGPMAGFVMYNPRHSKNRDLRDQGKDIRKAMRHAGAALTPLRITDVRRRELEGRLGRMWQDESDNDNADAMTYTALDPVRGPARFLLCRVAERDPSGVHLWEVCDEKGTPLQAMVDPACPRVLRGTYRSATTGDYDLWAIFPRRTGFSRPDHSRPVAGSERFRLPWSSFEGREDSNLGNITPRMAQMKRQINNLIIEAGYRGGNVVHHSDEAGRPGISRIDLPRAATPDTEKVVAFVPEKSAFCVETIGDLRELIKELGFEYVVSMNPGWFRDLGIAASSGGSYIV